LLFLKVSQFSVFRQLKNLVDIFLINCAHDQRRVNKAGSLLSQITVIDLGDKIARANVALLNVKSRHLKIERVALFGCLRAIDPILKNLFAIIQGLWRTASLT